VLKRITEFVHIVLLLNRLISVELEFVNFWTIRIEVWAVNMLLLNKKWWNSGNSIDWWVLFNSFCSKNYLCGGCYSL